MRAPSIKSSVTILLLGLLLAALITPALSVRGWKSYEIVETIEHALSVKGWDQDGLQLADGRRVTLSGIAKLPVTSEALMQTIQTGVEIDAQGNVHGLLRIHHWCGNDPCRNHVARVNVAHLLMFYQQGELQRALPQSLTIDLPLEGSEPFSEYGWNVSDYFQFQAWSLVLDQHGT